MEHMQGCAASSEWAAQGSLCLLSFIYHFISIDHCSSFSFVATAEAKCGEYCQKAVDCCPSNPEAYQMMASYLLSMGNVKVNDTDSCACGLLLLLCVWAHARGSVSVLPFQHGCVCVCVCSALCTHCMSEMFMHQSCVWRFSTTLRVC